MSHKIPNELPIKSKLEMLNLIGQIVYLLHTGQREAADKYINELKTRAMYLDEEIQHDVLVFVEQVYFQYGYDPWHKVTPDVQKAADQLIASMGFFSKLSQAN